MPLAITANPMRWKNYWGTTSGTPHWTNHIFKIYWSWAATFPGLKKLDHAVVDDVLADRQQTNPDVIEKQRRLIQYLLTVTSVSLLKNPPKLNINIIIKNRDLLLQALNSFLYPHQGWRGDIIQISACVRRNWRIIWSEIVKWIKIYIFYIWNFTLGNYISGLLNWEIIRLYINKE